mmetsp:Transcript_13287/g.31445  ORF Transcript_13287/g.31445 Transcript_13287/m.31445 type:complete len:106 (+) Transcript_13287:331-648(+)
MVKDDPTKLRKALKRREQQKKKSAKTWGKILKQEQIQKDEKQKTRTENLKNRSNNGYPIPGKEPKEDGKRKAAGGAAGGEKKAKNKTGGGAGFEGKKADFLNKGH